MNDKYIDGDFFESLANNIDIDYIPIDYVEKLISYKQHVHKKILITHNGDRGVDNFLLEQFLLTNNYDLWYAQNIKVIHPRLKCLPIGLERVRNCPFVKTKIIEKTLNENIVQQKCLYGNFSLGTNSIKRVECYRYFIDKKYFTNNVQTFTPKNQVLTPLQYEVYCKNILQHQFILCPEGNGIDTHRLWETLYLGRIPVVLHNYVNDSFSDMPILILDKWEDFEKEKDQFLNIIKTKSLYKLTQDFWKKDINEKYKTNDR